MLAFAACNAPPSGNLAPEGVDSTFEYLVAKYDQDGDGAVEPSEYTRDSEGFARLDANSDGELTPDDFPDEHWARDLGIRDLPADVRERLGARYAARAVVLAYFRTDSGRANPALSREALAQGFARLDLDGSGALDAAEFARATDALPWGGPGDAWEVLLAAVDAPPIAEPAAEPAAGGEPAPPPTGSSRSRSSCSTTRAWPAPRASCVARPASIRSPSGRVSPATDRRSARSRRTSSSRRRRAACASGSRSGAARSPSRWCSARTHDPRSATQPVG